MSEIIGTLKFRSPGGEHTGHVEVRRADTGSALLEIARGDSVVGIAVPTGGARKIAHLLLRASEAVHG